MCKQLRKSFAIISQNIKGRKIRYSILITIILPIWIVLIVQYTQTKIFETKEVNFVNLNFDTPCTIESKIQENYYLILSNTLAPFDDIPNYVVYRSEEPITVYEFLNLFNLIKNIPGNIIDSLLLETIGIYITRRCIYCEITSGIQLMEIYTWEQDEFVLQYYTSDISSTCNLNLSVSNYQYFFDEVGYTRKCNVTEDGGGILFKNITVALGEGLINQWLSGHNPLSVSCEGNLFTLCVSLITVLGAFTTLSRLVPPDKVLIESLKIKQVEMNELDSTRHFINSTGSSIIDFKHDIVL
jgi:hypothetical protein